jgi:hypothetical protein
MCRCRITLFLLLSCSGSIIEVKDTSDAFAVLSMSSTLVMFPPPHGEKDVRDRRAGRVRVMSSCVGVLVRSKAFQ